MDIQNFKNTFRKHLNQTIKIKYHMDIQNFKNNLKQKQTFNNKKCNAMQKILQTGIKKVQRS